MIPKRGLRVTTITRDHERKTLSEQINSGFDNVRSVKLNDNFIVRFTMYLYFDFLSPDDIGAKNLVVNVNFCVVYKIVYVKSVQVYSIWVFLRLLIVVNDASSMGSN